MQKIIFTIVLSLLVGISFVSSQIKDKSGIINIRDTLDYDSCFQLCTESAKENCVSYPNSPLCPQDIQK